MADVTLNLGAFDGGAARYARAMDKTLRTWGFETERRAKQKSPIDTGFNSNSIYTVTPDGKLYSNRQPIATRPGDPNASSSKGRKKYKPGQFAQQAELGGADALASIISGRGAVIVIGGSGQMGTGTQTMAAPNQLTCEVRVGAAYALFLELGTVHMAAQPFLGPAAAETTPMIDGLMRKNLTAEGLL